MKNYKTTEEQRERMLAYYYSHREQILSEKRKQRTKERQHKKEEKQRLKQHQYNSRLIEMYESWNLYILERLQSPNKLPNWIRRMMILQVIQNNNRINEIEKHGEANYIR